MFIFVRNVLKIQKEEPWQCVAMVRVSVHELKGRKLDSQSRTHTWVSGSILAPVGMYVGGYRSLCPSHIHGSLSLSLSLLPIHSLTKIINGKNIPGDKEKNKIKIHKEEMFSPLGKQAGQLSREDCTT